MKRWLIRFTFNGHYNDIELEAETKEEAHKEINDKFPNSSIDYCKCLDDEGKEEKEMGEDRAYENYTEQEAKMIREQLGKYGGEWNIPPMVREVENILETIGALFERKNRQYHTADDDMANFTTGALLRYKRKDMIGKFRALKDYMEKHVAHIYNNDLGGDKVDESLFDIANYCIIALVMHKRMKVEEADE